MKKLYLVRHAKSSWADPDMDDFDRPLNDRGTNDAPRMARLLKEQKIVPDRMISSPAVRALSTCKAFAEVLKYDPGKIVTVPKLYHASAETWLNVLSSLKEHKDDEDITLVFGHNPGITEFTNELLNISIDDIPTCGIVSATLKIDSWTEIAWGCGKLDSFDYPKK